MMRETRQREDRAIDAATDAAPDGVHSELVSLLGRSGSTVAMLDPFTARCLAAPVSSDFNKERTNLLLRRLRFVRGVNVLVDSDLQYNGSQPALQSALAGPCHQNWRKLRRPPASPSFDQALVDTLQLLGSPAAAAAAEVLAEISSAPPEPSWGPLLAATAKSLDDSQLAEALSDCGRRRLAEQLAVVLTRPASPRGVLLFGDAGCGADSLALAIGGALRKHNRIAAVVQVNGAQVGAGCVFPPERDGAFDQLLREASQLSDTLLVCRDLDVCLTNSSTSHALLAAALDNGLRLAATVHSSDGAGRIGGDLALARHLVAHRVDLPSFQQLEEVLQRYAATSSTPVAAAAIQTAIALSQDEPIANPAAAVGLLSAAIAEAEWRGAPHVGPDDVFAGRRDDYFEVDD